MSSRNLGWRTRMLRVRLRYPVFGLQNRQRVGSFSYSTSRLFGLTYESGREEAAAPLLEGLQKDGKLVHVLVLGWEGSRPKGQQLHAEDTNPLGTPLSAGVSRFLARDYDSIINLVSEHVPQVEYVVRKARALNRSASHLLEREGYYDLLVKGNRQEIQSTSELLLRLIRKIG